MRSPRAHLSILGTVAFVVLVVITPRHWVGAFVGYAVTLGVAAAWLQVEPRRLARRMLIEVPFLVFAALMPLLGGAPYVYAGAVRLSEPGLWAAWNLMVKGTLGVVAALLLTAQYPAQDMVNGLRRLRIPMTLTDIAGFFVRYLDVVQDEAHRMATARAARGFQPRNPKAWPALANGVGTLFIRSYERGERVHLAMLSRGFDGTMPDLGDVQSGSTHAAQDADLSTPARPQRLLLPWFLPAAAAAILATSVLVQVIR